MLYYVISSLVFLRTRSVHARAGRRRRGRWAANSEESWKSLEPKSLASDYIYIYICIHISCIYIYIYIYMYNVYSCLGRASRAEIVFAAVSFSVCVCVRALSLSVIVSIIIIITIIHYQHCYCYYYCYFYCYCVLACTRASAIVFASSLD